MELKVKNFSINFKVLPSIVILEEKDILKHELLQITLIIKILKIMES